MSLRPVLLATSMALVGCGAASDTTAAEPTTEPVPVSPVPETKGEPSDESSASEEPSEQDEDEQETVRADLPEQPGRREVAQVMQSLLAPIRDCADNAGPAGVLTVRVVFRGTDGTVAEVEITGSVSEQVRECAADVVRGARVQPFRRPTFKVSFPYRI